MFNRRMSAGSPPNPIRKPPGSAHARPLHSQDGDDQTDDHKSTADAHEADQPEPHHGYCRYTVEDGTNPAPHPLPPRQDVVTACTAAKGLPQQRLVKPLTGPSAKLHPHERGKEKGREEPFLGWEVLRVASRRLRAPQRVHLLRRPARPVRYSWLHGARQDAR